MANMFWKIRSYAPLGIVTSIILVVLSAGDLCAQSLRVGIIGDQTGTTDLDTNLDETYQVLTEGVETLKKEHVDLILHVGDLIESTRSEAEVRKDFRRAVDIISNAQKPWYISAGDHDVNPGDWIPNSSNRRKEKLFMELFGSILQDAKTQLYYSFDQGKYHFISLYSQEHLHTDPRWGNTYLARISGEQKAWLESDLKRNRAAAGTIIFLHQPLWYNWAGWAPIHQTLKNHGVLAVVAGHFHYDQDDNVIDGIHYLTIGATGAALKDANADSGGMHQVAVIDLLNGEAKFRLLNAQSGEEVRFTSRIDADRVQAIDYTMDGLREFGRYNRFYLKGDILVDNCISAEPAQMTLFNMGNPIDLPVNIKIQYDATKLKLTDPHFDVGLCANEGAEFECKIAPGTGITVSNPSGVSACFASCPTPTDLVPNAARPLRAAQSMAVWSSEVRPASGKVLKENDQLQIQVSMHFMGERGDMLVQRNLKSHPLARCADSE